MQWKPIDSIILLAATIGGIYVCYLLAAPFLSPLTLALVLAVLSASSHRAIEERLRRPNLSALLSVVLLAIVVVAPATLVAERLVSEAAKGATVFQTQFTGGAWRRVIEGHPRIAAAGKWVEQQFDLPAIFGNIATWFTNMGASLVQGSVALLISVVLTLLFAILLPSGPSRDTRYD